jgi:NifU-like protein
MTLKALTQSFPWTRYSKKLSQKLSWLRNAGILTQEEALARNLRLATGEEGSIQDGNFIRFYIFVDKEDGHLVDAKYQAFGQSALIAAAETACELIVGKNYDQASRISADLIDKSLRDKDSENAFPSETYPHLNLILSALEQASDKCTDLPLPEAYVSMPAPADIGEVSEVPGFLEMSLKKKLAVIEEILDRDIRPYISLDGGGVQVINLLNDKEVVITYSGNCTSCYSSIGTTLSYIQQVLRAKIHPSIIVIPDIDPSTFR